MERELLDEVWNAAVDQVLMAIDARIRGRAGQDAREALEVLRQDVKMLRKERQDAIMVH